MNSFVESNFSIHIKSELLFFYLKTVANTFNFSLNYIVKFNQQFKIIFMRRRNNQPLNLIRLSIPIEINVQIDLYPNSLKIKEDSLIHLQEIEQCSYELKSVVNPYFDKIKQFKKWKRKNKTFLVNDHLFGSYVFQVSIFTSFEFQND